MTTTKPTQLGAKALPNPYAPSIQSAIYKQKPSDFIVNEIMHIDFANQGEHFWLHLQKTNLNTQYVVKLLAKWANIPTKDIGFSGLKDRHAITSQWFSLRIPKKQAPSQDLLDFVKNDLQTDENIHILATHWHDKKLNRGTHKFNQFIITLQNIVGNRSEIDSQLALIKQHGVPNYFGEQRFGRDDGNVEHALELFNNRTIFGKKIHPKKDKDRISLYLSSARSELFNAILAKRVREQTWQMPMLGDVMNLAGSQSIFVPTQIDDEIIQRLNLADIHLTGAMWGDGELLSFGAIKTLEQSVIDDNPTYQILATGLAEFGLKQQRRALRLLPSDFDWQWLDDNSLQLDFKLPTGCFATTVLACLMN